MDQHLISVDDIASQTVMRIGTGLIRVGWIHPDPSEGRERKNVTVIKAGTPISLTEASIEVAGERVS